MVFRVIMIEKRGVAHQMKTNSKLVTSIARPHLPVLHVTANTRYEINTSSKM